jgi:hypothetical protein
MDAIIPQIHQTLIKVLKEHMSAIPQLMQLMLSIKIQDLAMSTKKMLWIALIRH